MISNETTTLSEMTRDIISEFQTKNLIWVYDDIIDNTPIPLLPYPSVPSPPPPVSISLPLMTQQVNI